MTRPLMINEFCRLSGRARSGPFYLVRKGNRYLYATAFDEGLTTARDMAWPFDSLKQAEEYAVKYGARVVRVKEPSARRGTKPASVPQRLHAAAHAIKEP